MVEQKEKMWNDRIAQFLQNGVAINQTISMFAVAPKIEIVGNNRAINVWEVGT